MYKIRTMSDCDICDGDTVALQIYEGWRASAVGDESISFPNWYAINTAWRHHAPLKKLDDGDLIRRGVKGPMCRISPSNTHSIQRLHELLASEDPTELIQTANGIEIQRQGGR